ncbi:ATP-dependent RNA helicase SUPV3L1, mitochondrial [Chionoecetes opilio]|uniref:ATP-dependent RNA helicase SUPV3L1, mitochondrial n=1 Tax=Chionoecetes opilio TaxID=41210 RepID=A0A8J5D2E8_CHIOP|nr:ATP-dependent RNA helicase SUPV3L1, mitochondrial [Chionoecetes opilio]
MASVHCMWAWTRALLGSMPRRSMVWGGVPIGLVHEVGPLGAGEEVEVRRYKRLTELTVEDYALQTLDNVQPGDCIVCFSKRDIHYVTREIERRGHEVAVIYGGGLPPGTKLAQAYKFNDPKHPCKIMVATDAIGMGLNLYRFPDMFPEGELVRDLQRELDGLIQDGVTHIVRLLRNSDARTSTTAAETEDTFIMDQRKKSSSRANPTLPLTSSEDMHREAATPHKGKFPGQYRKKSLTRGNLTERLLAQGLLSPKMLAELQREWKQQGAEEGEDQDSIRPRRNKPGKR